MRTTILTVSSVIAVSCCMLTSCDTPVGQGAAWGAATGAIIGGAASGDVRAASIGAAAGAAAWGFTRNVVLEHQAARYGPPPAGGLPFLGRAGKPGGFLHPTSARGY